MMGWNGARVEWYKGEGWDNVVWREKDARGGETDMDNYISPLVNRKGRGRPMNITVEVSDRLLKRLDSKVKKGIYKSRSEAVREAIRKIIDKDVDEGAGGRPRSKGRRLRLDWAGALRAYRDRYTSLELQRKALEWMGD